MVCKGDNRVKKLGFFIPSFSLRKIDATNTAIIPATTPATNSALLNQ
jgi:hypothetical protein